MALVQSGTFGSSPSCAYEIHANQTGGTGNRRTVQITVKFKVNGSSSQSSYGYSINWKGRIHNNYSGWIKVKGNEYWYGGQGFRSYSWTETVDVGTTSEKDITVGFQTDRPDGSSSWETTKTATFRVGKTNTAPSLSGNLDIYNDSNRSQKLTGIIPENISGLYLSWGTATDSEGGTLNYSLNQSKNNAGYGRVYYGTSRNYSMNIGNGNEGEKHRFYVDVQDNGGLWSNQVYSTEITKNTLTAGRITSTSISTIGFSTTSFVVNFGGGSNADGSAVKYKFFSDYIPVLNQTSTTGTNQTVTIWKSGSTPTGPYIRFEDLKNYVRSTNYTGTLQIALETSNNYGTKKYSYSTISINLQVSPTAATSCDIQMNTNSTAYKKVASGNNYYLIPASDRYVQIRWAGGGCQLGSPTTYRLYVQYGSGAWQVVADKLSPSTTSYNHTIPAQTQSTSVKYKIVVVTEFNSTAERVSPAQTLHYYSGVSLTVGNIIRGAATAEVNITVKTGSSIPNINTKGSWSCNGKTGTLSVTQNSQKINLTGLADNGTYTLSVTYNDDTGFSSNKVSDIKIGANQPIFFVNKYGVGIGGLKATGPYALNVNGGARIQGSFGIYGGRVTDFNLMLTEGEYSVGGGSTIANAPYTGGIYGKLIVKVNDGSTHNNTDNWIWQEFKDTNSRYYVRNKTNGGGWTSWARVYNTGYKPTPADIGAAASSHSHDVLNNSYVIQDLYNYTNGVLINTNQASAQNTMVTIKILGNGYSAGLPIDASYSFYDYTQDGGIINASGTTTGVPLTLSAFRHDGKLKIWFKQSGNYQSYKVIISFGNKTTTKPTYANSALPTSGVTNKVDITPRTFLPITGGTLTGHLRLNNGLNIYLPNNNGIAGRDTSGSDRYMMYMDNSNRIHLGYQQINEIYADGWLTSTSNMEAQQFIGKNNWLKIEGHGKHIAMGNGSTDCYVTNGKSNRFLQIQDNGNLSYNGSFVSSSDLEVKEDVEYLNDSSRIFKESNTMFKDFIKKLSPATFKYKGSDKQTFGFIAQDIIEEEVGKLFVSSYKMRVIDKENLKSKKRDIIDPEFGVDPNIEDIEEYKDTLMYDVGGYITVVAKALQEEIIEKDNRIAELEERLNIIEERMK